MRACPARHLTRPGLIAARPWLARCTVGGLLFEGVALGAVARAQGTPVWVMGAATLRGRARRLSSAMGGIAIHYAVKANDHLAVLRILADEGLGADVVSGGEMLRALHAGIAPGRIIFSGVGKTREELRPGAVARHRPDQRGERGGAARACGTRSLARDGGAGGVAGEPRCGCRHAGRHRHRPGGRQVRCADQRRGRAVCRGVRLAGPRHGWAGGAYRQPDHGHRGVCRRLREDGGTGARAALGGAWRGAA